MTEQLPMIINQERVGSVYLNDPLIIQDDSGNILSNGLRSTTRLTPAGIGILNNGLGVDTLTGIVMNAEGFAYENLDSIKTTTWENITTKIEAVQALSQASNSLTLNVDNRIRIQNGETIDSPTSYIDISSGITNEIISTTDLTIQAPNINMNGITTFNTTPINDAPPILGNELANKGYVDSLAGQYGGGYNLFFNYTNVVPITPPPVWRELSSVVDDNPVNILITDPVETGTQELARFITAPINITEIPIGIWEAFIYGAVSATANDVHYYFELWKRDTGFTDTLLATSGISPDVNASPNNNPTTYSCSATISSVIPLDPTDKLFVVLYVNKSGGNSISLSTYFEGNYYSYIQTSLNAGTTLLSSTNTWSASNNFLLPITTPTNAMPTNNQIINYGDITTLISAIPTPDLADVLGVGTDANNNTITNLNVLQSNSYNIIGSTSADYISILPTSIDITNGVVAYPNTHIDKTYFSINASSNQYAILGNIDTPRLSLNTPTKTTELTAQSFYINGFGNTGQVLTRRPTDFEYGWEDIPVVVPEPIVSTLDYYITTDSPFFQYPPSPPTNALLQAYQYYGWYFINSVALRKIDWFFAPDYAMIVSDIKGLYMNYFNVSTTSNDNLPFITIYTKPTGVDDYYPLFAHSSATYIANFTPTATTPFCSFMNITGTQPDPFPYGHQLGAMILSPVAPNPRGEYLPTEEILAISVGSNSTSSVNQVNFIMSKVGICLAQGNQELILNPQNIIVPASTWVNTATSNLNMSSFSIDASANNLSLGTLTSTGLTLGKAGNTTNIQGNLQIAGQAGTSGQVLTSAGSGSVPTWTTSTSSWVGNATSQLNMGIYDISGAVLDNNGGTLAVGGNTTTTTIGKATTGITDLQGIVKINNSAGTSGQVLTSTGTSSAPTWQALPASSWNGTATSQLNMGIYDISGAVLDNSGGLVTIGANTTGLTLGKTAVTTNIKGNLQINSASGTSGQVLTSAGSGSAPTWQTPTNGSTSLAVVKTNPVLSSSAFAGGSNRGVYNNNFLNITPPTLTATYLIKCQLTCNNQGTNASLFGNLGIQAGGGAQTTSAINAFNGTAMSVNTTFSQTNSLSQCSVNTTSVFGQLSFTYIHTPATLSTLSYALWVGTTGNGAGTIFSMEIIQIIA